MRTTGILGYGEVGKAIAEFCKDPKIKDIDRDDGLEGVEILHVCIPYSDKFSETVVNEIGAVCPLLVVIHSTVAPGTTRAIEEAVDCLVVHSPIRGIHPNLKEGVKMFVKFIGANRDEAAEMAKSHLANDLGLCVRVWRPTEATELAKLASTTYYGHCITFHREIARACEQLGVQFDNIGEWNETYNNGYKKLGKGHFTRPILYPPPERGIAGHCVLENSSILLDWTCIDERLIEMILNMGKDPDTIRTKLYENRTWLLCEYLGKRRDPADIAKQVGIEENEIRSLLGLPPNEEDDE